MAGVESEKVQKIDMHCHLLPGIDDGCESLEESLAILREMGKNGTERVYLTPHMYSPRIQSRVDDIKDSFKRLTEALPADYPELLLGSEVFLFPGVAERELLPLGDTGFLLVEFPSNRQPPFMYDSLRSIQRMGYVVILAHIERYNYLWKKRRNLRNILTNGRRFHEIIGLRNEGILFQVNWQALLDPKYVRRSSARSLLNEGFIDFVGSDKHSLHDGRILIDHDNPLYSQFRNAELL